MIKVDIEVRSLLSSHGPRTKVRLNDNFRSKIKSKHWLLHMLSCTVDSSLIHYLVNKVGVRTSLLWGPFKSFVNIENSCFLSRLLRIMPGINNLQLLNKFVLICTSLIKYLLVIFIFLEKTLLTSSWQGKKFRFIIKMKENEKKTIRSLSLTMFMIGLAAPSYF